MKPVLDLLVDANIVLTFAFCLWRIAQAAIARSAMKTDYGLQLRLLRAVLLIVVLSPILSHVLISASQMLWPKAPVTVSDLAVAFYLKGEIAMPAVEFEALLNTRSHLFDVILSGQSIAFNLLLAALLFGSTVLALRTMLAIAQVRSVVGQSYVWRRTRSTDVRLSDTATVPFAVRGLFRRHVVLPSTLVTRPDQLRIVLAHEFEHLRQGDVEWELIFEFLRPLLWFNPAFLLWRRAFDRLRELNCDQAVLETHRLSPKDYATCLLAFCRGTGDRRQIATLKVAFIRGGSSAARLAIEARLMALTVERRPGLSHIPFAALVCVLTFGVTVAALSVRQPGDWSHDRLMLSTIVNLERMRP
jgi:beta-lactamase regulating signal transducer with metallopeptidase domain